MRTWSTIIKLILIGLALIVVGFTFRLGPAGATPQAGVDPLPTSAPEPNPESGSALPVAGASEAGLLPGQGPMDDCDDGDDDCECDDDDDDCDNKGEKLKAVDDVAFTTVNTPVTIAVLANDEGLGDSEFTLSVSKAPDHGSAQVESGDSILYTPETGFAGQDDFDYEVCRNSDGDCDKAKVTVTVEGEDSPNSIPVAGDDAYSIPQDTSLTIPAPGLLENDLDGNNDSLTAVLVDPPDHGSLSLNADGSLTYTPDSGFAGLVSFSYHATDGQASSNPAIVQIEVVDTQSPTVSWTGPVENEAVHTAGYEVVPLQVTVSDNVGIDRVHYLRWDASIEQFVDIAIVTEPPYTYDLHTSQLNYEWNQIFALVYDTTNNPSEAAYIWIYVTANIQRVYLPNILH